MTRDQRRALLGDDAIAHIHQEVDDAPAPTPEVVAALRRIFTQPQGAAPTKTVPAPRAA